MLLTLKLPAKMTKTAFLSAECGNKRPLIGQLPNPKIRVKEYEGGSTDGLSYDGLGPSLPSIIGPYHPLMLRLHGWKSPSLLLGFLCLYALPGSRSTKKRGYLPGSLA